MSVSGLLKELRPNGVWTPLARRVYCTRRLIDFFKKNDVLVAVALSTHPYNRVLWDGIFRYFFRRFPERTDTYIEQGKEKERPWYYNEEVFDPRWGRLLQVYHAGNVYHEIIRPYLKKGGP